jgi:hypothetical protein
MGVRGYSLLLENVNDFMKVFFFCFLPTYCTPFVFTSFSIYTDRVNGIPMVMKKLRKTETHSTLEKDPVVSPPE